MAGLVEELANVLNLECDEYEKLFAIAKEKTNVIIKGDIETLREMTANEQTILEKIQNYEKNRIEAIGDIKTVLNIRAAEFTVKDIISILGGQPREQKVLSEAHDRIKRTLKDFKTINDMNKVLLADSLDMTEFNINLVKSLYQAPETTNYNSRSGYDSQAYAPSGRFDAKQ